MKRSLYSTGSDAGSDVAPVGPLKSGRDEPEPAPRAGTSEGVPSVKHTLAASGGVARPCGSQDGRRRRGGGRPAGRTLVRASAAQHTLR